MRNLMAVGTSVPCRDKVAEYIDFGVTCPVLPVRHAHLAVHHAHLAVRHAHLARSRPSEGTNSRDVFAERVEVCVSPRTPVRCSPTGVGRRVAMTRTALPRADEPTTRPRSPKRWFGTTSSGWVNVLE